MDKLNPKIFISHASEDNDFTLTLGKFLRANGVDAWVDQWEIQPGDKLVKKIFDEGIGKCEVFIVVLSNASIEKPWVKEELDTAVVKRIQDSTKLIPIRLDNCKVPIALKSTKWLELNSDEELNSQFQQILHSIYNQSTKPKIGTIPEPFLSSEKIDEYDIVESSIIRYVIEIYDETGNEYIWNNVIQNKTNFSIEEINDAIVILEDDYILKVDIKTGCHPFAFSTVGITSSGYVDYSPIVTKRNTKKEMAELLSFIVSTSKEWVTCEEIQKGIKNSPFPVNKYIDYLEYQNYLTVMRYAGTAPFLFGQVKATAHGRKALR